MILHKIADWSEKPHAGFWIGFWVLCVAWMFVFLIYAMPGLGVVTDGTPSGNATGMYICGSIFITIPTLIGTGFWWWEAEERWIKRRTPKAIKPSPHDPVEAAVRDVEVPMHEVIRLAERSAS